MFSLRSRIVRELCRQRKLGMGENTFSSINLFVPISIITEVYAQP